MFSAKKWGGYLPPKKGRVIFGVLAKAKWRSGKMVVSRCALFFPVQVPGFESPIASRPRQMSVGSARNRISSVAQVPHVSRGGNEGKTRLAK